MLCQQLEHTTVVLDTAPRPVPLLQVSAKLGKKRRQLPVTEDIGVIQRRRLAIQRLQVVPRIEALLLPAIRPWMPGDYHAGGHHLDVVHITLDRHRLKSGRARCAVAVVVEAHGLVLVHLGRLKNTWIEGEHGQRQSLGALAGEALADGLGLACLGAVAIAQRTGAKVGVQLGSVVDLGYGRGPVALQQTDAALDTRLLLGPTHQTESGLEQVMTGQGLVTVVELAVAAAE
jgi:hypothetical protein